MFSIHLATHKDKKALVSIRKNGEDVASVINQDGKNTGNQMMGQSVLLQLTAGDKVYVYAFTGTWTDDWSQVHFTQFLGKSKNWCLQPIVT